MPPFHPARPTNVRTETVHERQLESSALEGFVRTPLLSLEKPDQLQTTKQPDANLLEAGKVMTAPAQRKKKKKKKEKKHGAVKRKAAPMKKRLKTPWYYLHKTD